MSRIVGLVAAAGLVSTVSARPIFPEVEPNDSKAAANIFALAVGDGVTGNSIAATGAGLDYFRVSTAAAPLGIYRHRLVMTVASGTVFPTASIRGTGQTAPVAGPWPGPVGTASATETQFQTAFTPTGTATRVNQWYGFGKQEELYYRLAGSATSTADYTAVLESVPVVPTAIAGSFNEGSITISTVGQGHTTDTDLWVYDSNLNAIPGYGNDDESVNGGSTGLTLQSFLKRNYAAGTYYLALSNFQLANNMGSPSDDDFGTGQLLDFSNIIANSSTTVNLNMTFTISDGVNTVQVANTKVGQFDINWFSFTVVPAPSSLALLGLGGLLIGRRRR
jgi:hypothetical protein